MLAWWLPLLMLAVLDIQWHKYERCLYVEWSRDRWRHATLKGQGRDPKTFRAQYLENGWRYKLGCNRAPIGNGLWRVEWSRDRLHHVTLKGQEVKVVTPLSLWPNISKKRCRYKLGYSGALIGNDLWQVEWSRDRWRQWHRYECCLGCLSHKCPAMFVKVLETCLHYVCREISPRWDSILLQYMCQFFMHWPYDEGNIDIFHAMFC